MVGAGTEGSVKVYTVNGAPSGSASSLPDWLSRKRATKQKGKQRATREQYEGALNLVQDFEFPEASNRIRTTRDGHFAVATGTYKPQIKVFDLDQLTLKFERHSDAENVDFVLLSDDWTKSVHLQSDRSIELHTQGGTHYHTRIPRFGRAIAYHFPSCDVLVAGAGSEIYRLNLDQGRFLAPLALGASADLQSFIGVNAIDINPAHQLLAFGLDGAPVVEFWDPRSRTHVGVLRLPLSLGAGMSAALPGVEASEERSLSVTALASRSDGLSLAVGTSSGHTLLYDLRSSRHFAMKDQGYALPVKCVSWVEGGVRTAGDGMVVSADKKVVKIWDRGSPQINFASVTPESDINHVHHIPGSGMLMLANEGIQMTTLYIPQLGPAPKWCHFLDNITEELEGQTARTVYEDYKFVDKTELATLGLDHVVGTPALRPYMHGYFISLALYDAARIIANPFVYEEHRARAVKAKMDALAEGRIRTRADGPKVNRALAERLGKDTEKELRKAERSAARALRDDDVAVPATASQTKEKAGKQTVLEDARFKALFEDPAFQVDETTREYQLLNPSAAFAKKRAFSEDADSELGAADNPDESSQASGSGSAEEDADDSDSSGGDDLRFRSRADKKRQGPPPLRPERGPRLVALRAERAGDGAAIVDRGASFGERRAAGRGASTPARRGARDGPVDISWTPAPGAKRDAGDRPKGRERRPGVETFGAGMERRTGAAQDDGPEAGRHGRTQRRTGGRSGSRNVFRRM